MKKIPVAGTINVGAKLISIFASLFGWFLVGSGILIATVYIFSEKTKSDDLIVAAFMSSMLVLLGVLMLLVKSWLIDSFGAKYRKSVEIIQENVDIGHQNIKICRAKKMQLKISQDIAKANFLESIVSDNRTNPIEVFLAGGAGWEQIHQRDLIFTVDDSNLYLTDMISYEENVFPASSLVDVNIGGPGTVTSGGGFSGGGFGVEGFLKGAAFALVMNLLTSRTKTQSIIYLSFANSELIMFNSQFDPEVLRVKLSRLVLHKSSASTKSRGVELSIADQISALTVLRDNNSLTEEEFVAAKRKLLS